MILSYIFNELLGKISSPSFEKYNSKSYPNINYIIESYNNQENFILEIQYQGKKYSCSIRKDLKNTKEKNKKENNENEYKTLIDNKNQIINYQYKKLKQSQILIDQIKLKQYKDVMNKEKPKYTTHQIFFERRLEIIEIDSTQFKEDSIEFPKLIYDEGLFDYFIEKNKIDLKPLFSQNDSNYIKTKGFQSFDGSYFDLYIISKNYNDNKKEEDNYPSLF